MNVRVLVVEDEPLAAEAHAEYTRRVEGFEVVGIAHSATEASRLLGELSVDLVLLDMYLPDGHGLGLLRNLRAGGDLCDVIAVTSARDADMVRRAVAQGVRSTSSSRSRSRCSAPSSSSTPSTAASSATPRPRSSRTRWTGCSGRCG